MCYKTFPDGYTFLEKIDLMHNKKQFWLVQGLSVVILVVMIVGGIFVTGIDFKSTETIIAIAVLIVAIVIYIILHELTHGIVMYISVKTKIKFGFNGIAAYAGSTAYYDKKHYVAIALAPLVMWGIIFVVLNIFFHSGVWFWVIWLLQAQNISGATGDIFCTLKMLKYPKDILVRDSGLEMLIFRRKTAKEIEAEAVLMQLKNENGEEVNSVD